MPSVPAGCVGGEEAGEEDHGDDERIQATMPTNSTWYSRVLGRPMGSVVSVGSSVAVVGVDSVMVAIPSG